MYSHGQYSSAFTSPHLDNEVGVHQEVGALQICKPRGNAASAVMTHCCERVAHRSSAPGPAALHLPSCLWQQRQARPSASRFRLPLTSVHNRQGAGVQVKHARCRMTCHCQAARPGELSSCLRVPARHSKHLR